MLTARFDEALMFASRLHSAQKRKGTGVPYISHLLAVAALVIEDGGNEDEATAALLHDAIEDQGKHYPGGREALRQYIRLSFGPTVLDTVDACTDDESPATWRSRKQAHLNRIRELSPAARRVSCADKLHNARSTLADYRRYGDELWKRFRTGNQDDQLWYYEELVRAFRETGGGPLADELGRVVEELKAEVEKR